VGGASANEGKGKRKAVIGQFFGRATKDGSCEPSEHTGLRETAAAALVAHRPRKKRREGLTGALVELRHDDLGVTNPRAGRGHAPGRDLPEDRRDVLEHLRGRKCAFDR